METEQGNDGGEGVIVRSGILVVKDAHTPEEGVAGYLFADLDRTPKRTPPERPSLEPLQTLSGPYLNVQRLAHWTR